MTSTEALKKYESITATMSESFPENEFKTYRRESFTEQQLQTYLFQHYQRLDLLPFIEDHYLFKMQSYLHSGNWFREIGFPEESIKWYKAFFEYYDANFKKLSPDEKYNLVEIITYSYGIQADNYARIGQLDNAALQHKKNIAFIKDYDIITNPSAFNNYGLFFYWNKKDLDSALVYFNKAYLLTKEKFPNHTLLGSIRDNIADIYTNRNQYEKALPLYHENFKLYQGTKNESSNAFDVTRFISAGIQLIETELKLDNISQAQETFNDLQKTLEMPEFKGNIRQQSQLEILQAEKSLYQSQGNYKAALVIADKRLELLDSFNALSKLADKKWQDELNAISLDRFALNAKIDRIEKENKIQSQRSKLWIITLSSSIILILLLSLFLRRRQHIINAKNKQLLAEHKLEISSVKNENLQSEIESKQRDLSDFAINLTQNQEWAQDLANKLETIKEAPSEGKKVLLAHLEQDIQNRITFDTNTHEFYDRLDKLSDAFYSKLNGLFTNLSKNEIRMCSLIRLKMDSRSIATLQNITLASLNTSRYRLRKKLNLSENEDLDTFIQNL
ncbi:MULTISPECIES: hypothetical protein [Bizionia]|uniref:Tetratricopeptide repeat protein n=1 Tax=Bizionia algoritergicola TaxID=291187 RepID=A0A5D0QZ99_9FLAO|nr:MULTISPECIES: hypothetical protein [Bizionia]OBX24064.1 hypothetical protein BAA08_01620 [Bizionia sp. APA-3]TYB73574.1 hypothetical protein ES675_07925 [Bizionia algoritergicola]